MLVRVTCAGVVIGTAQFDPPQGVAHASLSVATGYGIAAPAARLLGESFVRTQPWSPEDGDFADVASARWRGGRLALQDMAGRELAVQNVVVIDGLPPAPDGGLVRIVADFRTAGTRIDAQIRPVDRGDCGRKRGAA
jgi:hypothetical protein